MAAHHCHIAVVRSMAAHHCHIAVVRSMAAHHCHIASQTSTIPYHTIPYHTIPYHTIPYRTIPYHTIPYRTIPYHTIPYHTIPYHTIAAVRSMAAHLRHLSKTTQRVLARGFIFVASTLSAMKRTRRDSISTPMGNVDGRVCADWFCVAAWDPCTRSFTLIRSTAVTCVAGFLGSVNHTLYSRT